ncbi:MAG TPA: DUF4412 domain-containing protein [Chthoniobacterales bacterium]|nr:DUF4412 domain-containing protein [Chthoniobacterales bacterium]
MNVPGLSLIITAFLLVTARGDLSLVQKVEGSGSVSQITIKLKGDKARVEVTPQVTTLIDRKTGDMLTLMNAQKKFVRISADKSKAIVEMANKYSGDPAATAEKSMLKPTGKKEMIHGYEAEEYVRESPALKESYWIALQYPDSAAIVKQLQSVIPAAWNEVAKGVLDFRDFPGLPLRTIIKADGKEIISTITSIKQDALSDAEFSVPKDFQELKVPNLQELLGEKPSVAPSTKP